MSGGNVFELDFEHVGPGLRLRKPYAYHTANGPVELAPLVGCCLEPLWEKQRIEVGERWVWCGRWKLDTGEIIDEAEIFRLYEELEPS